MGASLERARAVNGVALSSRVRGPHSFCAQTPMIIDGHVIVVQAAGCVSTFSSITLSRQVSPR